MPEPLLIHCAAPSTTFAIDRPPTASMSPAGWRGATGRERHICPVLNKGEGDSAPHLWLLVGNSGHMSATCCNTAYF